MSASDKGGNTPCACGSTNGVHPRGTWGCAYEPAGGNGACDGGMQKLIVDGKSICPWCRRAVMVRLFEGLWCFVPHDEDGKPTAHDEHGRPLHPGRAGER